MKIQVPTAKKSRGGEAARSSKELERWSPGMMREVARRLVEDVQRREVRMMGISWDEHIQLGHVPFRRDCKICQESRQKQHPHRKVKHPLRGVLSLDTSGAHKAGQDLANQARYMMVGAFTWLVPKDMKNMKEEDVELPDDALQIEDWKDGRHLRKERRKKDDQKEDEKEGEVEEVVRGDRQAPEEDDEVDLGDLFGEDPSSPEGPEDRVRSGRKRPSKEETKIRAAEAEEKEAEEKEVEEKEARKEETEGKEVPEGREVRVFRLVAPMASKRTEETLKTAIEFVMRLRADGFWVNQIHTDQGHEYYGQFKTWCTKRGIILTRTAGDDPQGNGRAEVAVYAINRQVRATLLQTGADEVLRCARVGKEVPEFPAFLQKVTVRKRNWEKGSMAPACEVVKYLFPAWDHHGHWVMKDDGTKLVTRYVLRQVKDVSTTQEWIAIEEELVNALVKRRGMREKTAPMVRRLEGGDEKKKNEEEDQAGRVAKIIEEEMGMLIEEDPSIIPQVMQVIGKLRRLIEGSMDDEILQTRIVSPLEVLRDWKEWVGPAKDEVNSLLHEKKAFKEISSEELEELNAGLEEEGRKIEIIPSKLVWTKKAGPKQSGARKEQSEVGNLWKL